MRSSWRLLALAAALHLTCGVAAAAAQRVMVRNAPVGTPVEVVLNSEVAGTGTIGESGDVTIGFTLPEVNGKAEMDANVFVDVCDKLRRVVIVDRNRPAPAVAQGCDRREISGLFWVRRVNTIVIDLASSTPTLLLINGNYTPPKPASPEEEAGEERPHAPLPKGLVMFAGGGMTKLRDFGAVQCGTASPCSPDSSVASYGFGATFWLTRNFGIEGSYLNPTKFKVSGGDTFTFNTNLSADIWSILGKAGVQAGAVRIYGHGGVNYHDATLTTTETIDVATQKIEVQTKGWNWTWGGGLEGWIKNKVALYGEFDLAKIKGKDQAGGEAVIDDRATAFIFGVRVHVGG